MIYICSGCNSKYTNKCNFDRHMHKCLYYIIMLNINIEKKIIDKLFLIFNLLSLDNNNILFSKLHMLYNIQMLEKYHSKEQYLIKDIYNYIKNINHDIFTYAEIIKIISKYTKIDYKTIYYINNLYKQYDN